MSMHEPAALKMLLQVHDARGLLETTSRCPFSTFSACAVVTSQDEAIFRETGQRLLSFSYSIQ